MENADIRPARPGDAAVVADYHRRCFLKTYAVQVAAGELEPADLAGMTQQLTEWFEPGFRFETWVAVVDDVPIGHLTIWGNQLVHLFVDPDHHGTGLGRHLLEQAETTIVDRGHTDLELHTRVDNVPAIAFYEKAGWTQTEGRLHTEEHGIAYDELVMVKHRRS